MSSKVCPKTCGLLSTAAVFISVGVVQLLAGIILLKSEYVYLLAGLDFLAAITNGSVGSFLGIASSLWENKFKQMSGKNIARQNILAGLYISVMAVNATTAIVMIMGDGNKLLTMPGNVDRNNSAVFVLEILACAYVTSVCSPIVCIVVALVCLSGNRIQIHENTKERESIAKTESYGWVFQNNHGTGPKKLSDVIQSPLNRNSSSSDDVFLDKKCCLSKKSFLKKFSKKSRNSLSSLRELQSPLEIWDYKRKKILQEITEPNKMFFSDDYLQFPDFNYGSYMETILPRIKQTSLIHPKSAGNSRTSTGKVKENQEKEALVSLEHTDEVDTKPIERVEKLKGVKSYKDQSFHHSNTPLSEVPHCGSEEITDSMKRYYSIQYKNEKSSKAFTNRNSSRPVAPNRYAINTPSDSPRHQTPDYSSEIKSENIARAQDLSHIDVERQEVQNCKQPSVPDREAMDELESKFTTRFEETPIRDRGDFMKSFKSTKGERFKGCDSKLEQDGDLTLIRSEKVLSENLESNEIQESTPWAGEVVPISVHSRKICPQSSIPVSTLTSRISECQSTSEDLNSSDFLKENLRNSTLQRKTTGSLESPQIVTSLYERIDKVERLRRLDVHPLKISSESEKLKDIVRGRSTMSSIPEYPTEDIPKYSTADQQIFVPTRGSCDFKLSRANTCKTTSTNPKHNGLKPTQSTHLLKRLWSSVGNEDKTDISNLIMDIDSLVGLSDEELMSRTSRLREIRKSVIMRSKNEG